MTLKNVLTKKLLVDKLLKEKKPFAVVAQEVGCSKVSVTNYAKRFNLYEEAKRLHIKPENNLLGHTYGKLKVIALGNPDAHGKRRWQCRCTCGKLKLINAASLKRGLSKSCGYCERVNFTGYETVSGSYVRRLKQSADNRELIFKITAEDIYNLWIEQDKKCALSGIDIFFCSNQDKSIQTASVDRIDNSKGYTKDNIQIIHKRLNRVKSVLNNDEFVFWCHLVAEQHQPTKTYDATKLTWTKDNRG